MKPLEKSEEHLFLWARALGSVTAGLLFAAAFVYAFNFTWLQGIVLSWMYCLLKDAIETLGKK